METKINIAKILKNKQEGTKLWTDMFGSVTLYVVTDACDAFQVKHHNKEPWFDEDGKLYKEGVLCIYPSKSMRDWSKFAWKKGDVLQNNDHNTQVIFDRFISDTYEMVRCKYWLKVDNGIERFVVETNVFTKDYFKVSEELSQCYINEIENRCGGKLNLETLEIEKQTEFKDGDIVVTDAVPSMCYSKCIFILKGDLNTGESRANSYVFFNINNNHISYDVLDTIEINRNIHLATDSEKKQLFDAIEKDGKAWNAEKKQIVDLKPKWTPKTFDKVITRVHNKSIWTANIFSHIDQHEKYVTIGCISGYTYCLPYNDETAHLIGTTDEWKGREG